MSLQHQRHPPLLAASQWLEQGGQEEVLFLLGIRVRLSAGLQRLWEKWHAKFSKHAGVETAGAGQTKVLLGDYRAPFAGGLLVSF